MGTDGGNMACVDCHVADRHHIKGQFYSVSSDNLDRISRQTCHINLYSTQKTTKTWWNWSRAG